MKIDKKKLFAMNSDEFDDSPEGWRSLADGTKKGRLRCARIIEEYLKESILESTQKGR